MCVHKLLTSRGEWDRAYKEGQIMTDCKRTFISTLGSNLSRDDELKFERKLQYCREILGLLDKFHPGCNYERGNRTERLFSICKKIDYWVILLHYIPMFIIMQNFSVATTYEALTVGTEFLKE